MAAKSNDFVTVYQIRKQLAGGRESFDGLVRDINIRLLIHDDEQLNK